MYVRSLAQPSRWAPLASPQVWPLSRVGRSGEGEEVKKMEEKGEWGRQIYRRREDVEKKTAGLSRKVGQSVT